MRPGAAGVPQVLVAGNGGAALGRDGGQDAVSYGRVEAAAVLGDTGIMHHDAGTAGGQKARICRTKAPSGPCDDRDLAIEADCVLTTLVRHDAGPLGTIGTSKASPCSPCLSNQP